MVGMLGTSQAAVRKKVQMFAACLPCLSISIALFFSPVFAETDPQGQVKVLEQEVARLFEEGRYVEAIPKAREALAILERALGSDHPDLGQSLNILAFLLRAAGDYAGAKPLYERALKIYEKALRPEHLLVATTLNLLANLLTDTGDFAAARPLYERALAILEAALGRNHPDVAPTLNNLAELLRVIGDFAAAKSLYERALQINEQALGPDHPHVVTILNNLALLHRTTGDFAAAKSLYERALKIRERTLGPTHPDVAMSLDSLAELLYTRGDFAAAKPLIERALKIDEQVFGPNHPRVAANLNSLAELLRATGDFAAAKPHYERALKIREDAYGPTHIDVATSLNNLAILLRTMGDLAGASSLYARALRIYESKLGPNHPLVATSLNNLAFLLHTAGDYAAARPLYERALRIQVKALGPDHPSVAVALNNLAGLLQTIGEYIAARPLFEQALRIQEKALGPDHPSVALAINNLAGLLQETREYSTARSLHERALKIRGKALGQDHPDVATSLNNLGGVLHNLGDYAAAELLYQRALQIIEAKLGPTHPNTAASLQNFAIHGWETGRPQDALQRLVRAVEITRANITRGLVGLSHRQKLALLQTTGGFTDTFLSLPSGLATSAEAYRAILDRKNLLFRTLVAERTLTEANQSPLVAALLQDYTAVRQQLAALAVNVPNPQDLQQYQARVSNLTKRLEALEADLSRTSAMFRQAQAETTAGPSEVCAAVPLDAALIDVFWYWRYVPPAGPGMPPTRRPHYVAFLLRQGECTYPIRVDLGPAAAIDQDVRRFLDALGRDAPDPAARELRARYRKTIATRLHARLFPPALQQAIAGKSRLLIAPDGALALLPFGLLPGEDGHEFLIETRTISYLPSGRDLLRTGDGYPSGTGLVALGAPAFDFTPVQVAQATSMRAGCGARDEVFTPLPGTAAELEAIARVYKQAHPTRPLMLLDGPQATKAGLLEQATKAGVLHLATHAYFAGEECTPAGVTAAPPQRTIGEPPAFLGHNPLLLAGIALAGANEREKADGILTALEVTALDLRGTDLVVLSACDTGLGTAARGQELLGLRWAFSYAGARNLVTSLWSVPDAETATLMTHFYTGLWLKGLSVPEALRAAQLEMLREARAKGDSAPHTWGAFVVSGRAE